MRAGRCGRGSKGSSEFLIGDGTPTNDGSPNGTQRLEYYARAFENGKITFGPNGVRESYMDEAGTLVATCSATILTQCDQVGPNEITPGLDRVLATRVGGDDMYTKTLTDCEIGGSFDATTDMMNALRKSVVPHEVGHGMSLGHTSACGTIMFTLPDQSYSNLNVYPIPVRYSPEEIEKIRLFQ